MKHYKIRKYSLLWWIRIAFIIALFIAFGICGKLDFMARYGIK